MRAFAAALLLATMLGGCSSPVPEFFITVENQSTSTQEVWLRVDTLRGDIKQNGPLAVAPDGSEQVSMGRFQGTYRFTALLGNRSLQDIEAVLPGDGWTVEVTPGARLCFRFGPDGAGELRCQE